MSGQHFRFLHAGGFLLDQPLSGLVEIPEPLTDLLIDAPFSAAQKVFDAAEVLGDLERPGVLGEVAGHGIK